jgi:hypothetical protein
MLSNALDEAQIVSFKNDFNDSGIGGGFNSILPIIKWSTYSFGNLFAFRLILNVNIVDTINLCLSNNPLLAY